MKPPPFDYVKAQTLPEACELLMCGHDVRAIAGGQTLIPMLAMRLARPSMLVDLAGISGLDLVREEEGCVEIGAMVRQAAIESMAFIAQSVPLLALALPWIGHAPTRARGTIGGSIANADPAAEIPLVAVALGAEIIVATPDGEEIIPAEEFFIAAMVTALPMGGIVRSIRFPSASGKRAGSGFSEINARNSDFAFAAVAAHIELDAQGLVQDLRFGVGGVSDVPVCFDLSALHGEQADRATILDALRAEIKDIDAFGDLHASAIYRRRAASALAERALDQALSRLGGAPS